MDITAALVELETQLRQDANRDTALAHDYLDCGSEYTANKLRGRADGLDAAVKEIAKVRAQLTAAGATS